MKGNVILHLIGEKMFFRTDMAIERRDLYRTVNKIEDEINGIECDEEQVNDINITRVRITNKNGEKALQRKIGQYITVDIKKINNIAIEKEQEIINVFSKELLKMIDNHIDKSDEILIIGLGNEFATPDSLGSKVVQNIEITRHIKMFLPNAIDKNTRTVSAISPRSFRNNWY